MTDISKKIQFSIDKETAEVAESFVKEDELAKAKLIQASYKLPTVKVNNKKAIDDFLKDDGGY